MTTPAPDSELRPGDLPVAPDEPDAAAVPFVHMRHGDQGLPEAVTSMLRTIIVALFVLTFVTQPMVIPSESMEHTLLVGDFLLMNRATLAPPGDWGRVLPYAPVERGEIVTFHSQLNPAEYLVKRVIGLPGDRLHIDQGRVFINGRALDEPYATFEPIADNSYLDHFPSASYTDPRVEPSWWKLMQASTENGDLVIPAGKYFMMGDNRNHSLDSRYWGFVPRGQIIARPLVIYFSLNRPSRTDLAQAALPLSPEASAVAGGGTQSAQDDRLGHDTDILGQVKGFARWMRFFHVVH